MAFKRDFRFILAFIIIVGIYVLINYFLGNRIYQSIKIFSIPKWVFQIFFWFCSMSFIINQVFINVLPKALRVMLAYTSSYYLGFLLYAIIFFSLSFLIHHFFKIKWDLYLISIILILGVIFPVGIYQQLHITTKEYTIQTNKITQDYTIVLATDFHLGDLISNQRLQKMIDKINSVSPDLVLIAGDLIDSNLKPVLENESLSLLTNLESRLGVYITMGNHDFYTGQIEDINNLLTTSGVHVLNDETVILDNELYLIGRKDSAFGKESKDLKAIVEDNEDKYQIVMDHNPSRVDESIDLKMDMQVSGHTHNGQLYPLNYITDAIFKIGYGHQKFDFTDVFVSGGIGSWGPKLRTSSTAEFSVIHLKKES